MSTSDRTGVLAGLGTWLPARRVDNEELAAGLDTTDEWIRTRTGIRQRYVVDPGTATSDLAYEAGARALKSAGLDRVDLVVLATVTPDQVCPATAPEITGRLGMSGVPAFDVGAVCSGFVYGLATASGLISVGVADSVLLIGADTFTTLLDPQDRTNRAIFGDGAGAVVLRAGTSDEPGALGPFDLGSDGDRRSLLEVPAGGSKQRFSAAEDHWFRMQGRSVFKHAVERMTASASTVRDRAGWAPHDVDCLVAHQANKRILDAVALRLDVPADRCVIDVDRVGNTVAASIPLAFADGIADGVLRPGHRVLLTAFGAGLTWGSTALVWPDLSPS